MDLESIEIIIWSLIGQQTFTKGASWPYNRATGCYKYAFQTKRSKSKEQLTITLWWTETDTPFIPL